MKNMNFQNTPAKCNESYIVKINNFRRRPQTDKIIVKEVFDFTKLKDLSILGKAQLDYIRSEIKDEYGEDKSKEKDANKSQNSISFIKNISEAVQVKGSNAISNTLIQNNSFGRYYYPTDEKVTGLLYLPNYLRGYILPEGTIDVDGENMHPVLLYQIMKQLEVDCPYLENYVKNRDALRKQYKFTKEEFIIMVNDQKFRTSNIFLDMVHREIYQGFMKKFMDKYINIYTYLNEHSSNTKNPQGSFIAYMLQEAEQDVMYYVREYLTLNNIEFGCLIYDGIHIYNNPQLDLTQLTEYVKKACGYEVNFAIKSFKCQELIKDVIEKTKKSKLCNIDKPTPLMKLRAIVEDYTDKNKIRKYQKLVYKEKAPFYFEDIYAEYNNETKNAENKNGIRYFLDTILKDNELYNSKMCIKEELTKFYETTKTLDKFKELEFNRKYIAFKNCLLQLDTGKIIRFEDAPQDLVSCRNYLPHEFDMSKVEEDFAFYDNLIEFQIKDPKERRIFYSLLGRLFFPLKSNKKDKLQIAPFLKGKSFTGKSQLVYELLKYMLGSSNVGKFTNDDNKFQVAGLYSYDVVIEPDMKKELINTIDATTLQQMISGEAVSLRGMIKVGKPIEWTIPMFFIGNFFPEIPDQQGAIKRRFAFFRFDNIVTEKDGSLCDKLKEKSPSLLYMLINKYLDFIEEYQNESDFNKIATENMKEAMDDYQSSNDRLKEFLSLPLREINGYAYSIIYREGAITPVQDLTDRFKAWFKKKYPKETYHIDTDSNMFDEMKFKKESIKVCKACGNRHQKDCCKEYARENRTTKTYFKNMEMIKKPIEYNIEDESQ
jgi:phage/plasmid-associated DNA primase